MLLCVVIYCRGEKQTPGGGRGAAAGKRQVGGEASWWLRMMPKIKVKTFLLLPSLSSLWVINSSPFGGHPNKEIGPNHSCGVHYSDSATLRNGEEYS